jgi:alpha-methylacyl-CoA racemase
MGSPTVPPRGGSSAAAGEQDGPGGNVMGPLDGLRVLELGGIGPTPFSVMLLADLGAEVVRIDRVGEGQHEFDDDDFRRRDVLSRGRRSLAVDMKQPRGRDVVLRLVDETDVLIEGLRPGVTERLGLGPSDCLARNPRLIYGRMTGWGQSGPYAQMAGHDINYIALAGVLDGIGRPGAAPTPPLNYLGDFGGGALFLVSGVLAALHERSRSGAGQVVDAAMLDGSIVLNAGNYALLGAGWNVKRGEHMLSGAAPHYDAYECADRKWISVAPNESRFYQALRDKLQLTDPIWDDQHDRATWPERKRLLEILFKRRTRDEWCAILEGTDACFAPVLDLVEAATHPHNAARRNIVEHYGQLQPAPAPRFDRTPAALSLPPPLTGQHTEEILKSMGYTSDEIDQLAKAGAIGVRP